MNLKILLFYIFSLTLSRKLYISIAHGTEVDTSIRVLTTASFTSSAQILKLIPLQQLGDTEVRLWGRQNLLEASEHQWSAKKHGNEGQVAVCLEGRLQRS